MMIEIEDEGVRRRTLAAPASSAIAALSAADATRPMEPVSLLALSSTRSGTPIFPKS